MIQGNLAAIHHHVAGVTQNMPIAWIETGIIHQREIDLKIFEQVVAGYEVIGVGKTARFRLAGAQMALSADGNDLFGIARVRLREPHQ